MSGQERTRKKGGRPGAKGADGGMLQDISDKVPEVDSVLGEVDAALASARRIDRRIENRRATERREVRGCGC